MNIIVAISRLLLIVLILWDVFMVLVLTRRATRQFQFTRPLVILFRSLDAAVGRAVHDRTRREQYLSVFGPLFLFFRFSVWAAGLIVGFGLLQWAVGSRIVETDGSAPFRDILYFSGNTFLTLVLSDTERRAH